MLKWKNSSKGFKTAIGGLIMIFGMILLADHLIFPEGHAQHHVADWIGFLIFAFGASILLPFEFAIIIKSAREFVPYWRPGVDPDRRKNEEEPKP